MSNFGTSLIAPDIYLQMFDTELFFGLESVDQEVVGYLPGIKTNQVVPKLDWDGDSGSQPGQDAFTARGHQNATKTKWLPVDIDFNCQYELSTFKNTPFYEWLSGNDPSDFPQSAMEYLFRMSNDRMIQEREDLNWNGDTSISTTPSFFSHLGVNDGFLKQFRASSSVIKVGGAQLLTVSNIQAEMYRTLSAIPVLWKRQYNGNMKFCMNQKTLELYHRSLILQSTALNSGAPPQYIAPVMNFAGFEITVLSYLPDNFMMVIPDTMKTSGFKNLMIGTLNTIEGSMFEIIPMRQSTGDLYVRTRRRTTEDRKILREEYVVIYDYIAPTLELEFTPIDGATASQLIRITIKRNGLVGTLDNLTIVSGAPVGLSLADNKFHKTSAAAIAAGLIEAQVTQTPAYTGVATDGTFPYISVTTAGPVAVGDYTIVFSVDLGANTYNFTGVIPVR